MSQPPAPTIISLKHSFLQAQTRLLSQPLQPTRAWRNQNSKQDQPLPEKAIDDALCKLNNLLAQHSRRVYAPQATRHVAEQIEALYLTTTTSSGGGSIDSPLSDDESQFQLTTSTDLADPEVISSLPSEWESSSSSSSSHQEHTGGSRQKTNQQADSATATADLEHRYRVLVRDLQSLSAQRESLQTRLARLRGLRQLLSPFAATATATPTTAVDQDDDNDHDSQSQPAPPNQVQENLVTRHGEVEKELEKMRVLLARVGGRVSMLTDNSSSSITTTRMDLDNDDDDDDDDGDDDHDDEALGNNKRDAVGGGGDDDWERKKVEGVLNSF